MSQHPLIWVLYKIHNCGLMSQHLCMSGSSARSMSPDPYISIHTYLRILCKIHVSDSCLSIHVSASIYISGSSARSMSPDPCLSIHMYLRILYKIHVFGFMSQHPLIWILYKIHVFGLMSQHLCISGSSARSMSPDPYISIHMYLRILCKIHVSGFMSQHPYVSQDPLQDPCLRIHI